MNNSEGEADAADFSADLASQELTLTEFCIRLSSTDRRVEMIGGFEASERAQGTVKATEAVFMERFQAFVTKPV